MNYLQHSNRNFDKKSMFFTFFSVKTNALTNCEKHFPVGFERATDGSMENVGCLRVRALVFIFRGKAQSLHVFKTMPRDRY